MNNIKYAAVSAIYTNGDFDTQCIGFEEMTDARVELEEGWLDFARVERFVVHCSWGMIYEEKLYKVLDELKEGAQ